MMMVYYLLPFQVNYVALITLYRRHKRKVFIGTTQLLLDHCLMASVQMSPFLLAFEAISVTSAQRQ